MNGSEMLAGELVKAQGQLDTLRTFAVQHGNLLAKFSYASISYDMHLFVVADNNTELARLFCQSVGGEWKRKVNSDGGMNYETTPDGGLHVTIYGAEAPVLGEPLVFGGGK